jgi:hypothetical protein
MTNSKAGLPIEIQADAGALLSGLCADGRSIISHRYEAEIFGNWEVKLDRNGESLQLTKDRSQYMVDGQSTEDLKAAGLWRAFDDRYEFQCCVLRWSVANKP